MRFLYLKEFFLEIRHLRCKSLTLILNLHFTDTSQKLYMSSAHHGEQHPEYRPGFALEERPATMYSMNGIWAYFKTQDKYEK